jgi:hypothetical protein
MAADHGCYVGDHWGNYAIRRMIEVAKEFGFTTTKADDQQIAIVKMGEGDPLISAIEYVDELADRAQSWLNEHIAPEDTSFDWFEGGFYLWPNEQWKATGE